MSILLSALLLAQGADHASAELVSSAAAIQPGVPFSVAVVVRTDPEWHVYWANPGDSGMATVVDWKLPAGWKASALRWPTPRRITSGGQASFGYEDEVRLLATLTPPKKLTGTSIPIKANVRWLVCQEACIPGSGVVSLNLPVATAPKPHPTWAPRIEETETSLPKAAAGWQMGLKKFGDGYELAATLPEGWDPPKGQPDFFPLDASVVANDAPKVTVDGRQIRLKMKRSEYADAKAKTLRGLLVAPEGTKWKDGREAVVVNVPLVNGG